MEELKRCPFCGGLPATEVRVTQMGGGEDHIDFSVICTVCGTDKTARLKIKGKACFTDVEQSMDTAIKAWNRRATEGA